MKLLLSILITLFSANAFACKVGAPVYYSRMVIDAALEEFARSTTAVATIHMVLLDEGGFVDVRAKDGNLELRTVFKVSVNPDCTLSVALVKP